MPASLPLLRSPDFPWARPATAAVSVALHDGCGRLPWRGDRYAALLEAIRVARVGGAFWARPAPFAPAAVLRPRDPADALAMAEAALAHAAPAAVLALLPAARGARTTVAALAGRGIAAVVGEVDPWSVLTPAATLHAHAEDEMALLAYIAGSRVVCAVASTEELADRVRHELLDTVSYRDPFRGRVVSPEAAVAILAEWRGLAEANRGVAAASGVAWWKRRAVERMLWRGGGDRLVFARSAHAAVAAAGARGGGVAAWPSRMPPALPAHADAARVPLLRIEDGFVRSAGLGADLHPPCSIVVDRLGAHYDPSSPSTLERLLGEAEFPPELLARAERLIARLVRTGVGKYGGGPDRTAPERRSPERCVLVVGQVEDDLSVRLGGAGIGGNRALLQRVRMVEPDSRIWFRPHPDVEAGHRRGALPSREAGRLADRIVAGGSLPALLDRVDRVHVLTSQTGFEALLRGRPVVTHGHPFYAGWGLTSDLAGPLARRTRRLTLAQLVAGALILYPRYLDPDTGLPCTVELLVERLARPAPVEPGWVIRARRLQGRLRRALAAAA